MGALTSALGRNPVQPTLRTARPGHPISNHMAQLGSFAPSQPEWLRGHKLQIIQNSKAMSFVRWLIDDHAQQSR